MNNTMEYKGYVGSVEFSEDDCLFYGKVQGIRALISYEGENASELVSDFHGAVDDYLAHCEAMGTEPEKAYKGSFNVRIAPELHKAISLVAYRNGISLNTAVEEAISAFTSNENQKISGYSFNATAPAGVFSTSKCSDYGNPGK